MRYKPKIAKKTKLWDKTIFLPFLDFYPIMEISFHIQHVVILT